MTYITKTGRVLTDEDIEALADEAERGYLLDDAGQGYKRCNICKTAWVPLGVHACEVCE